MGLVVKVFGTKDQTLLRAIQNLSKKLAPYIKDRFPSGEIHIIFVNNKSIADLNLRFLGRTGPTDVLSFPLNTALPPENFLIGEVYVSREQAKIQARAQGSTLGEELLYLVQHGILHLAGFSHREMKHLYEKSS